jgi:hypothetical protein
MAVIDAEPAGGTLFADGADAVLALQHEVVIAQRHAVDALERRVATLFRTIEALLGLPPGVGPTLCAGLVSVGRVTVALVRAHARALVGVLALA